MVYLGDEAQVVARFSPFGDGVILTHAMELQGDVGHVESRFGLLETVLMSVEDRCTVCAKRANGSEIILDTPDGSPM